MYLLCQAAVPRIIEQTDEVFFQQTINVLKNSSDICYRWIKEIPCISCPYKPEGSMAVMVRNSRISSSCKQKPYKIKLTNLIF